MSRRPEWPTGLVARVQGPNDRRTRRGVLVLLVCLLSAPANARAQEGLPESLPAAFSLASGREFTTRDRPFIQLTFQRVRYLDFRVYRVSDPFKFFKGLRELHQLGSPEAVVPQERTWLERIAAWKADRRDEIRRFAREQFSHGYRVRRLDRSEREQLALRQTIRYTTFAQMPLLNRAALVTSWREVLPVTREAEARRIPLEHHDPGVYLVEAVNPPLRAYTVVVISNVGIITKTAPGQTLVFAANRLTGEPATGCRIETITNQKAIATGATDAHGLAELTLGELGSDDVASIARCGDQVAISDLEAWYTRQTERDLVGYVYTDRPIYRPGHVVRLKAILRWRLRGALTTFDRPNAEIVISDNNDKVVLRETRPVDQFGALHSSFNIPAGAALGYYAVQVNVGDQQAHGTFEVQEYRKPEFEVAVRPESRFAVQGNPAIATITARYYFGQPVARGRLTYALYRSRYVSPYRWTDTTEEFEGGYDPVGEQIREDTAQLDDQGRALIRVPLELDEQGEDYTLRVEARVTDQSGREVSGHASINATSWTFLLASSVDQYVYKPGSEAQVRVRAVAYDGAPQTAVRIDVALEKLTYRDGRYDEPIATEVTRTSLETDTEGNARWRTTLPTEGGDYRFQATTPVDDRVLRTISHVWIPGRESTFDSSERILELIPDRRMYQPGDVAHVMIRGDAFEAAVLVTKEAQQVSYRRVTRTRANEVIEVPISEDDIGDTYVNIAFLKNDRLYRAERRLSVPPAPRQIQLTVSADRILARPREPALFTIKAADQNGHPLRAQVSVGVVDEAVYGVKPDDTPDPLRFFYRREYSRVGTRYSREYFFVGYSGTQQILLARRRRPMTLADFKTDQPVRPDVRKEFPDAIHWVADLVTGADGVATLNVTYPDSLTTWRVTARAVTIDTKLGSAVARTTTTKDLILRVIAPRFLTEGDHVTIPAIVHNYLPDGKTVDVALEAQGLTASAPALDPATLRVVSGGEQRTTRTFVASAPGRAILTGSATVDGEADAVQVTLPILPYGLKRDVSQSGSLPASGERITSLEIPETSNPAARSIEVSVAPSLAGSLVGALDFLTSYPYGCTEQTLSSFLPNLLVLRAMNDLGLPQTERLQSLDRQISEGLQRLYDYQHDDGGWGWWKTDENHPFMTAYALYGLLEVQAGGYKVDHDRIRRGTTALLGLYSRYPRAVPDLKAYEVYVLGRLTKGRDETFVQGEKYQHRDALDNLWSARDRMSPYGRALLLLALEDAGDSRAPELASALASEARTKGDLAWWEHSSDPLLEDFADSSVEATAYAVKGLAALDPKSPLIEQAVRWLLANRTGGLYWSSTKQTAMVLYGLLEYMKARGEAPAAFDVEVFVNGASAGSRHFTESDWTRPSPIIFSSAGRVGTNDVRLVKKGDASMYWTATARYFYNGDALEPTGSRKLAIVRRYFTLKPVQRNGRIVYRETPFDGSAVPGDLLLVRLTVAGSSDWRYLVIEDPLPAGTEAIADESLFALERPPRWWYGSQRELRDNRVVLFQERFTRGRYEFQYLLKVVTPGTFRAMPAQVQPMYVPGINASTEAETVRIEALK
ncbi:MAG: hypothetical protein HYX76_14555 [Acidobacteria bacterium]|nr:hypothetical protein [Acidobacteriota bacterium]